MSTDQMLRQKVEIDNIKDRRTAIHQSVTEKKGQFDESMKARIAELRTKSRDLASKSIKGFSEDTEKAMREFARAEGLTDAETDNVLLDPRSYRVIYKAMQYDKVQSAAQTPVQTKTGILRPGASGERMSSGKAAELNFRKAMNGAKTSSQKARVIEDRLAGAFAK